MKTECPTVERLKAYLENRLPESEQLEVGALLESNEEYARKLEAIAAGGKNLDLLKHCNKETPAETSAYWPALKRIEEEFESPPGTDPQLATTRPEGGEPAARGELKLDFLDPPEKEGSLGRLDRFHIMSTVGRGGMGIVFRSIDGCLDRVVAIKLLDPQYAKNDLAHDRFCREARSAAKIMHENVVAIHHVDENEAKELPYIVMQYINGESLQERLDKGKPLELYDIVRIGKQIAAGLGAAHAEDLIHRDVKPANILIEERTGRVLLTDFGLARMNEDVKLTQTGFVAGTPLFMSPEQARGEAVDYRSDLFSLGSVLYAMCTGNPPFPGTTPFLVLRSVTELVPKPIGEVNPSIPDWLVDIIDKLLAKDPKKRFDSADRVAELMEQQLPLIPKRNASSVRTTTLPRFSRTAWGRRLTYAGLTTLALVGILLVSEAAKATNWTVLGQRGQYFVPSALKPEKPLQVLMSGKVGPVWSVAYGPKNDIVAMGVEDGTILIRDPKNGETLTTFKAHDGPVWSLAFNAEGTELVSTSDDCLKLWRLSDTKEMKYLPLEYGVRCLAMSRDGSLIATGGRNGILSIHDIHKGETHASMQAHNGTITSLAFSPVDDSLVTGSVDQDVKTWTIGNRVIRKKQVYKHDSSIYSVAFSPDGKTIASGGWDRKIRLWDSGKGEMLLKPLEGHKGDIWCLAFGKDGKYLISGSTDHFVKFWNAHTGELRSSLLAHEGPLTGITITSDNQFLVTSSRDGTAHIWTMPK